MSADPAMEWLALARDEPEIKQLPLSAFTVYCRHLLITQSMPNAPAFLQQTSAGRDADASLVRQRADGERRRKRPRLERR